MRDLIGSEGVTIQDRRLTLEPGLCWVDALEFCALLERAAQAMDAEDDNLAESHLGKALELYRGPFLEGEFDPPEILSAREKLHSMFLRHGWKPWPNRGVSASRGRYTIRSKAS